MRRTNLRAYILPAILTILLASWTVGCQREPAKQQLTPEAAAKEAGQPTPEELEVIIKNLPPGQSIAR